jgi:hypothetical protein
MDEELRKHFEKNRPVFDSESPDEKNWTRIRSRLDRGSSDSDVALWWKVAAVFFMALSVVLLIDRQKNGTNQYVASEPVIYHDDFREVKSFYTSIIEQKKEEFEQSNADPKLVQSFEMDITRLDSAYAELEHEYEISKNDRIVEAMINNLKTKIDVLSRYMDILNEMKEKESDYENQQSV